MELGKPYATEQLAVSSSPVSLTAALVNNSANYPDFRASGAMINVITDAIYYTLDGSTPSSTNGINLAAGGYVELHGYQKVKNFKAIRVTSDATINVQYFKT
jgi:hypothetical protein